MVGIVGALVVLEFRSVRNGTAWCLACDCEILDANRPGGRAARDVRAIMAAADLQLLVNQVIETDGGKFD